MSAATGPTVPASTWMTRDEWVEVAEDPKAKGEWEQQKRSVQDLKSQGDSLLVLGFFGTFGGAAIVTVSLLLNNFVLSLGGTCVGGVVVTSSLGISAFFASKKFDQYHIKSQKIEEMNKERDYWREIANRVNELLNNGSKESKIQAERLQKMLNNK